MTTRRKFIQGAAVVPAAALATPALAQSTIKWRMQTYAGAALADHVIVPAVEMFNKIAGDRMQIELFFADQLVPTGELFQAMQRGTIDAVQSDDDSMASPTEVTVFGGYFPLALRYSWLCRRCSTTMVWTRSGKKNTPRSASSISRQEAGIRATSR